MPLPFKDEKQPILPNNKNIVLQRLNQLKRRIQTDDSYRNYYFTSMNDFIEKGYVEKVELSEQDNDGHVWYIPHHRVYHPQKPDKNKKTISDFLWWKDDNLDENPIKYRMNVHLFGVASSPGCASFGLNRVADDYEDEFGSDISAFLRNDFYVDDGLSPVIDSDGIIRVGGRFRRAEYNSAIKHSVIIPRHSHITELIIRHFEKAEHQGRGMTVNEIRANGFWIIGCSSAFSKFLSGCITCRKLTNKTLEQIMANLPIDRLNPVPPFTYCSVDLFGPSFINALRRFIAIRGPVRHQRSERGSNFEGVERELREVYSEMDDNSIRQFLSNEGWDFKEFKMNVRSASHMRGVWERQIRSVRNVLALLMHPSGTHLDDKSLRKFMCEAAAIVNSRPLAL
ncbi:unnamed protein product [Mytilus coruscus]|uniref:Integrase zinc-binding domain-containing protein n=1 Tax=Mytilus coruscus TaxID=42192 RepID=A0A6J8DS92_MYTCO|nr:unnamed protein product [Mytilus coruscus]